MNYFESRRTLAPLSLASDAYGCTYIFPVKPYFTKRIG